jgi:hypothetical protein
MNEKTYNLPFFNEKTFLVHTSSIHPSIHLSNSVPVEAGSLRLLCQVLTSCVPLVNLHPHWYHGKNGVLFKIASKVYEYNNNFRRLNHGLLKLTFAGLETSLNQMTMGY